MRLRDLVNDVVDPDRLSKTAVWVHASCVTLTVAFVKEAWTRSVSFETLVGYAIAIAVACGGAPAAMKFVALKFGRPEPEAPAVPPAAPPPSG